MSCSIRSVPSPRIQDLVLSLDELLTRLGEEDAAAARRRNSTCTEDFRSKRRARRCFFLFQIGSVAEDPDLVLSLDELLTRLGEEDAVAERVAQLHLFAGLSVEETGEALGLSRAMAYRNWKYARAWLREALKK